MYECYFYILDVGNLLGIVCFYFFIVNVNLYDINKNLIDLMMNGYNLRYI